MVVRYCKIVPNYIPKDIIMQSPSDYELFQKMLGDGVEVTRELNPKMDIRSIKMGSYLLFTQWIQDTKTEYKLRGAELEVNRYQKTEDHNNSTIVERILYKVPDTYYKQWVEYCLSKS